MTQQRTLRAAELGALAIKDVFRGEQMLNSDVTRQELRAILADPDSSQEQILEVKLFLARRIAEGTNTVRRICERDGLSPEKSAAFIANHQQIAGEREAWAE